MRQFFDTSVLVAAFWGDHPQHAASLSVFAGATKAEAACAAHSLAEVYAVMTRLPVKPAILPDQALLFVQEMRDRLTLIPLEEADYSAALQQAAERGIAGGRIYDALLLQCAAKAGAEIIYTWNVGDFQRLAPDLAGRIRTP
jgi:predicted nucleic acid-binding protein